MLIISLAGSSEVLLRPQTTEEVSRILRLTANYRKKAGWMDMSCLSSA